jgi:hypothetical protein
MFEPEVKRGAKLLDEIDPNWVEKIDIPELQMSMSCSCILGQVFGDYEDGLMKALEIDLDDNRMSMRPADDEEAQRIENHGFCLFDRSYGYSAIRGSDDPLWKVLEHTWIDLIKERQS